MTIFGITMRNAFKGVQTCLVLPIGSLIREIENKQTVAQLNQGLRSKL